MRWTNRIWTTALLLAGLAGCKQQCFITLPDRDNAITQLTNRLDAMPEASQATSYDAAHTTPVSTILDPDRPKRFLSLAEAVSIALEHGTRGIDVQGSGSDGRGIDNLGRFNGAGQLGSDQIRVLALDPAIAQTQIEAALSKFDAIFQSSMSWNTTDRPIGTAQDVFQAGRSSGIDAIQTDSASFNSSLTKPLPTGGVVGMAFKTDYQFSNLPAAVNPAYTPALQFQFEQPLLQGFGVEINELRASHPGSILNAFSNGTATQLSALSPTQEGILLTRIRFDQSRAEFEATVNNMVLNVENAYWNLYGSYWNLYSRELALRLAYDFWRITRDKQLLGGAKGTKLADLARARGQYELFRGQRIDALARVLESERQLRKLLGMPVEDGQRMIPSDTPTLSPYQPDLHMAVNEALALRPELVIAREDLKARQLLLRDQKNLLLPDLRSFITYDVNSIGPTLDGAGNTNALRNLAENNFNSWSAGLRLTMQLGYRQANANLRRARLELARSAALVKDQEDKAVSFLAWQYRRLYENYEQIKSQRAQREAYGLVLRMAQLELSERTTLGDQAILEAQRFFAEALAGEYNAIVQYNNSLAAFEYAKGTLLHHNNIVIGEGDLPECARERAVDHFAKRSAAIVLAKRPDPLPCPDGSCAKTDVLPDLPKNRAVDLPTIMQKIPQTPEAGDWSDLPSMDRPVQDVPGSPVSSSGTVPMARPEDFGTGRMMSSSILSSATLGAPRGH